MLKPVKDKIPIRSYTGECWKTNKSNKKRLVIDFEKKCSYCDDHDHYSGGYNSYHVEHFAPKEKFKHLEFTYDNLLYCCPYCNISKSNKWVGANEFENIIGEQGFVDPCSTDYNKHLVRNIDGSIGYITPIGAYMYTELKLYLRRHMLIHTLEKVRTRRKMLQSKIEKKEKRGEDTKILREVYKHLCVVFSEYYDIYFEED
ncbi:HNH endonuclease [Metasolibacillus meyeri]|uniref:HNH endonuclease n=1 Tax=Metasolibacillus meyeri TaxID=1071052 RepID=A0AAW9NIQ9_9BACL|nr:HNH endonuclease [Metasolibacillus meyeri]MEC1177315.1 HNH endonuclease [Metasolibacillus meyeri]